MFFVYNESPDPVTSDNSDACAEKKTLPLSLVKSAYKSIVIRRPTRCTFGLFIIRLNRRRILDGN